MRYKWQDFFQPAIDFSIVWFKLLIIRGGKHFIPCINKKSSEKVKYPVKLINKRNSDCNKNNSEEYCHQDPNEEHTAVVFLFYIKGGKYKNENENIVNTKTPFHQVAAQVFQAESLPVFNPHKNKKSQCQTDPEKGLVQCLFYGYGFIFFTQKSKIENKEKDQYNSEHKIREMISCHQDVLVKVQR